MSTLYFLHLLLHNKNMIMLCYFGGEEIHNEIMNSLLKQNHNSSV